MIFTESLFPFKSYAGQRFNIKTTVKVMLQRAFRKLLSVCVFSYLRFGFEGRIWDVIISVPGDCLSFYFLRLQWKMFKKF